MLSSPRSSSLPRVAAAPAFNGRVTLVQAPKAAVSPSRKPAQATSQMVGPLGPWTWLVGAIWSGRPSVLPGDLPAYTRLDPASKLAAIRRGAGRQVAQPLTSGTPTETAKEDPLNLIVTGSLGALTGALVKAGWCEASTLSVGSDARMAFSVLLGAGNDADAPVSPQFLKGKPAVVAFNKNSEHARGRDHLRIFALAPDARTGADRWAIAATRDTGAWLEVPHPTLKTLVPKITLGHDTDPHIDAERDMIMQDLLSTGAVGSWSAVAGQRAAGLDKPGPDGVIVANRFHTDGRVYEVTLVPHSAR
jgi:hypothetical protein